MNDPNRPTRAAYAFDPKKTKAKGKVIGFPSDIVPPGFFELIPSEYREAAARGDFESVSFNYRPAAVKEWKRWQREARRRFNETYKVERTGIFITFIAPCCIKKTITSECVRLVPRFKSAYVLKVSSPSKGDDESWPLPECTTGFRKLQSQEHKVGSCI